MGFTGGDSVLPGPPSGPAGGDIAGTGANSTYPNPTLTAIGAAAGPIGSSVLIPVITIDAKGRVTALTSAGLSRLSGGSQPGVDRQPAGDVTLPDHYSLVVADYFTPAGALVLQGDANLTIV